MKELREILETVDRLTPGERGVLATVVDVKGSGYRLAGTRMLIGADGRSIGTVSGGCLESDVLARAKSVIESGRPTIVVYDSTQDQNTIFGLQMGCRGVVRILLEPADDRQLFDFLRTTFAERRTAAVATVISEDGLGQRIYFRDGSLRQQEIDVLDAPLPQLTRDFRKAVNERRSRSVIYGTSEHELELFIEVIEPPPSVLIFGAGYDAIPLATFAKELGWNVTVLDRRSAYATEERFPAADSVIAAQVEEFDGSLLDDESVIAVVMTHHFDSDREIVRRLASARCRYIGVLGPRQRTADLLKQLSESGVAIGSDLLSRVHSPVGLDIGAATPESIALSIVAEIQAFLANREGGHLKNRTKPIYDR
jgi:xanthine/CO dehydrogenase XdhC/CoxF family maturation factor